MTFQEFIVEPENRRLFDSLSRLLLSTGTLSGMVDLEIVRQKHNALAQELDRRAGLLGLDFRFPKMITVT